MEGPGLSGSRGVLVQDQGGRAFRDFLMGDGTVFINGKNEHRRCSMGQLGEGLADSGGLRQHGGRLHRRRHHLLFCDGTAFFIQIHAFPGDGGRGGKAQGKQERQGNEDFFHRGSFDIFAFWLMKYTFYTSISPFILINRKEKRNRFSICRGTIMADSTGR